MNALRVPSRDPTPTVLLGESDPALRQALAVALRDRGFAVVPARDGVQLSSLVRASLLSAGARWRPALIVTDLEMPGPDGLSVLARLRRTADHTPAIVLTTREDRATRLRLEQLGVAAVLRKPFEPAELGDAAWRALSG